MDVKNGLQKVGKLCLRNQGGFVVKLDFVHYDKNHNQVRVHGSGRDIVVGLAQTSDPGKYGIQNGEEVTIYADVAAGRDNTGTTWFIYEKGSLTTAKFTISGTTFNNRLYFDGCE